MYANQRNGTLASGTHDPALAERGRYEVPFIERVMKQDAKRAVLLPWQARPPVGLQGLEELARGH
jgi:arsenite-transporting ATPase